MNYEIGENIALKRWERGAMRSKRNQMIAALYARLLLERKSAAKITQEDWHLLGLLYRPNASKPGKWVRKFIYSRVGQIMTAKELQQLLFQRGITPEGVIDQYKELFETAISEGKLNVAKGILDRFAKMLGMNDPISPQTSNHVLDAHLAKVIAYVDKQTDTDNRLEEAGSERSVALRETDSAASLPSGQPKDAS